MTDALWRVDIDGGVRLARGPAGSGPVDLLPVRDLDALVAKGAPAIADALAGPAAGRVPPGARVLAPVGSQPVWAAGVTYASSRMARNAESGTPDVYDRVYAASRPELFYKADGPAVVGPGEPVGIRADSGWDVPEPEVTLVFDASGELAGYCCGNDMSSRAIEGDNPLYLPQAKVYRGSCALGPCIVPAAAVAFDDLTVELRISRAGACAFTATTRTSAIRRGVAELSTWLFAALDFPVGVFLMTGTGIVPGEGFTLAEGDTVQVTVSGLGSLTNPVHTVGRPTPP